MNESFYMLNGTKFKLLIGYHISKIKKIFEMVRNVNYENGDASDI